jgi:type IV pilus assembly protein PilW
MDLDGSKTIGGFPNEIIRYALNNGTDGISDAINTDWVNSGAECSLGRETGGAGGLQPVANNIDAIEFLYVLEDGTVTDDATGSLEDIRGVIVSILARTKNIIKGYRNTKTYLPASNAIDNSTVWGPFEDSYRRNLYITRFKCRNMGRNPYASMK